MTRNLILNYRLFIEVSEEERERFIKEFIGIQERRKTKVLKRIAHLIPLILGAEKCVFFLNVLARKQTSCIMLFIFGLI